MSILVQYDFKTSGFSGQTVVDKTGNGHNASGASFSITDDYVTISSGKATISGLDIINLINTEDNWTLKYRGTLPSVGGESAIWGSHNGQDATAGIAIWHPMSPDVYLLTLGPDSGYYLNYAQTITDSFTNIIFFKRKETDNTFTYGIYIDGSMVSSTNRATAISINTGHTFGFGQTDGADGLVTTAKLQYFEFRNDCDLSNPSDPITALFNISYPNSSAYVGDQITFSDRSTGVVNKWEWNFGDGGHSTEQNPKHSYSIAGDYTITLTASNTATNASNTGTGALTIVNVTIPSGSGYCFAVIGG